MAAESDRLENNQTQCGSQENALIQGKLLSLSSANTGHTEVFIWNLQKQMSSLFAFGTVGEKVKAPGTS